MYYMLTNILGEVCYSKFKLYSWKDIDNYRVYKGYLGNRSESFAQLAIL